MKTKKYQIWDKVTDLYTPGVDPATGKGKWGAQEYIATHAPWAENPAVKVVIGGGPINCNMFIEFETFKDVYRSQGAEFTDDMTDQEILDAIEEFQDRPMPEPGPSPEERIAAALEFNNLLNMAEEE